MDVYLFHTWEYRLREKLFRYVAHSRRQCKKIAPTHRILERRDNALRCGVKHRGGDNGFSFDQGRHLSG